MKNLFELRLVNPKDPKFILESIDKFLAEKNITQGRVTYDVAKQTAAYVLQKMLTSRHFSVCAIRECAEVLKLRISSERMRVYNAIHCVNYGDMEDDYRQTLIAMVIDDFRELLTKNNIYEVESKD